MKKIIVVVIALCMTGVQSVNSHPHVFMETSAEFIFNENEFKGFKIKWKFDEMFSALIMEDCDKNKDGAISEKEIKDVEKDYFSNLKDYNYFCHMIHDDKKYEIKKVEEFNAYAEDKKMVYEFTVPVNIVLSDQVNSIKLSVYDDTNYISIGMSKTEPVLIKGICEEKCSYKFVQNSMDDNYYGQTVPTQVVLSFKK